MGAKSQVASAVGHAHAEFSAPDALRRVAGVALVGLALGGTYRLTGLGVPCPLLATTGLLCPFCGGTRMVASAMQGDLAAAFGWNPFLFVLGSALGLATLGWVVEVLRGPRLRLPARWGPMSQEQIYLAVGSVAVVFAVLRNVL
ncbi:DUF2752 domain-containing protein [Propionibacteriaceae bacterium G57]|uniref:DUF2752 domain-containing protein n=1 Tax=Aestuariimicrobium sp. G57 TaxID=3418485 RepID=UPI003DA77898